MNQRELIDKARAIGLAGNLLDLPKKSLIRAMQKAQGREPCFLSDSRYECAGTCEWKSQCKRLIAEWRR
jgi:hypothetical protein